MKKKIAIIGVGNMGGAIAKALAKKGYDLLLSNRTLEKIQDFKAYKNIEITESNAQAAKKADLVFLGVKPKQMEGVVAEIKSHLQKPVISMVLGESLGDLRSLVGHKKVVRIMPNTPASLGESMTAVAYGQDISKEERAEIEELLLAFGKFQELEEDLFPAFCALVGSMPAFINLFIEGASDGGVFCGLKREDTYTFLAQTLKGTAKLLETSHKHPGLLKDQVCSPGGASIRGVEKLEEGALRSTIAKAVIETAKYS